MNTSKILVVDDESAIRHFLVRVLERGSYEVAAAINGQQALQMLQADHFDLLLTDIKMDHLDGVALLQEAKQRYPDLAVILLTGHATVGSAVAALRQGAHNYLLKPVKNEDMLAAIAEALEERSRQQRRDQLERLASQMLEVVQTEPSTLSGSVRSIAYAGIKLDPVTYSATLHGNLLDLTPTEFRLLLKLCQTPEASFDYVTLVQAACGYTCSRQEAQEIIGTHVRNLRQKLSEQGSSSVQIESVRGIGYRLVSNIVRDTTS